MKYDRSIYDALFVALAADLKLPGVTTDEPLYRAVSADFPQVVLFCATASHRVRATANFLHHCLYEPEA